MAIFMMQGKFKDYADFTLLDFIIGFSIKERK